MLSLLIVSLLLSTHGSADAAKSGAGDCAIVGTSEVRQALGRWVAEGDANGSGCTFAGVNAEVSVSVQHLAAKLDLAAEIASLQTALPDAQVRDVAGLGTRAFFLDIPGAGAQLHVIRGERDYLMVSVLGFGEAVQVSQAAEAIARKALTRF